MRMLLRLGQLPMSRADERPGRVHVWWMFVTYQLTNIPMFWAGSHGMNRRISEYPADLVGVNVTNALYLAGMLEWLWS